MDAELENLIRQLDPDVQAWIRTIIASGMSIEMIRQLLTTLLAAGADRALIMKILARLARLGMISGETLEAAAAEANAIVAEAEGAGGAAAAGGITGAALAAILLALAAVAFAIWAIGSEAMTDPLDPGAGGTPCGMNTKAGRQMATVERSVEVSAWGGITSYNKAIAAAQLVCASLAANCAGNCPPGKSCKPSLSVQSVDQKFRFFWNTTTITFKCPCECQ